MEIDRTRYKIYTWKHPLVLHWIINPGLVINELLLGQRIPQRYLVDKTSDKTLPERTFVPCPHCDSLHDGRTWSVQNRTAFKNWFGLYCPNCGHIIPCLMNATTWLVLALTYPLWGWFRKSLREKWLRRQPARFENLDLESTPNAYQKGGWIWQGFTWGLLMYITMTFLYPLFSDEPITWARALIGIPIWALAGLGFGYAMKQVMGVTGKTDPEKT